MYRKKFQKYQKKVCLMKGGHQDEEKKNTLCDVCQTNKIQLLFGSCGHCVCQECYDSGKMTRCHLCRAPIRKIVFIPPEHSGKEAEWFFENEEDGSKRYLAIADTGTEHVLYQEQRPEEMDPLTEMALRDARRMPRMGNEDAFNENMRIHDMIENLRNSAINERAQISTHFKGLHSEIDYWCDLIKNKIETQRRNGVSLSEQISFCKERIQKTIDRITDSLNQYDAIENRFNSDVANYGLIPGVNMERLSDREPHFYYRRHNFIQLLENARRCLEMN